VEARYHVINGNDTLTIQYEGSEAGDRFNCQGIPLTPTQSAQSLFYINTNQELVCSMKGANSSSMDNAYTLINNVDAMVIRLGEDNDEDGLINHYVAANDPNLLFSRVRSVRVSLLLRTDVRRNWLTEQYYTLDGEEKGPFHDQYVRKVLTTTIPIKKNSP
jgi:hypothetical protein